MRSPWVVFGVLCAGCGPFSLWPSQVVVVETGDTVEGDLSSGQTMSLDWAENGSIACFTAGEFVNFEGPHVLFGLSQVDDLIVTATPDTDVDVSLYVIQEFGDRYDVPPGMEEAVGCEASFDAATDSNPGVAEEVTVGSGDYNVLIGVAGPADQTSGAFSLAIGAGR